VAAAGTALGTGGAFVKSRIARPAILALLVLLLVAGSAPLLAGAGPTQRAATGSVDTVSYGTDWNPENRNFLSLWKWFGWGIEAKMKAARAPGYTWVHIPITLLSYNEGSQLKIDYVEFCAQSSNGVATKPTALHLWEETGTGSNRFYQNNAVSWPADNNMHCIGADINPPVWKQSLGVSVRLYFANSTDKITLGKAWAHLVP
jgi:hypothetical protein